MFHPIRMHPIEIQLNGVVRRNVRSFAIRRPQSEEKSNGIVIILTSFHRGHHLPVINVHVQLFKARSPVGGRFPAMVTHIAGDFCRERRGK